MLTRGSSKRGEGPININGLIVNGCTPHHLKNQHVPYATWGGPSLTLSITRESERQGLQTRGDGSRKQEGDGIRWWGAEAFMGDTSWVRTPSEEAGRSWSATYHPYLERGFGIEYDAMPSEIWTSASPMSPDDPFHIEWPIQVGCIPIVGKKNMWLMSCSQGSFGVRCSGNVLLYLVQIIDQGERRYSAKGVVVFCRHAWWPPNEKNAEITKMHRKYDGLAGLALPVRSECGLCIYFIHFLKWSTPMGLWDVYACTKLTG